MAEPPIDPKFVQDGAAKVTSRDIETVVRKSDEIEKKFRTWGPLQRFMDDGRLLIDAVRDYWSGRYRQFPLGTIGAMAFALLYVFNPFDIFPDVIPIIGQIDDAAVVAGALLLVEHDLRTYALWRSKQVGSLTPPRLPPPP